MQLRHFSHSVQLCRVRRPAIFVTVWNNEFLLEIMQNFCSPGIKILGIRGADTHFSSKGKLSISFINGQAFSSSQQKKKIQACTATSANGPSAQVPANAS